MSTQVTELARRAVACKGWRWMPGMRVLRTTHPVVQERGGPVVVPVRLMDSSTNAEEIGGTTLHGDLIDAGHAVVHGHHRVADMLPDLTDPATVGCLVALVREVRNEPTGFASVVTPEPSLRWAWVNGRNVAQQFFVAPDELEAIILALENAA